MGVARFFTKLDIMKIRRKFLNAVIGNTRAQKTLSVALALKKALGQNCEIKNWNPNKIKKIIRISPNTFSKLLPDLIKAGYVKLCGKNKENLVVCKLYSDTANRNISVDLFDFGNGAVVFMEVYRSLRTFVAMQLQHKKNFLKRVIQSYKDPKRSDNYRLLRRKVKRLVKGGILNSMQDDFKEWGISYKRIAKQTGNCERTAQVIIKYGIAHGWLTKKVNIIRDLIPNVCGRYVPGYDFTTRNFGYILKANSYSLSEEVELSLGFDPKDRRWLWR